MSEDPLQLTYVKWYDSHSMSGWYNNKEIREFCEEPLIELAYETVGWLLENAKEFIVLAMSVGHRHAGDMIKIPRAVIIEMYSLNSPTKEKSNE